MTWTASVWTSPHLGGAHVVDLTIRDGRIDEELSTVTTADITADTCGIEPGAIIPRVHELRLERDGVPTFAGPILVTAQVPRSDTMRIAAADRMWWPIHTERHIEVAGDVSTVAARLIDAAARDGATGLTVDAAPTGRRAVADGTMTGGALEQIGARWVSRAGHVQIGEAPFATLPAPLTVDSWTEPPAVLVAGGDWHPDRLGAVETRMVDVGMWRRTAEVVSRDGPPRSGLWRHSGATDDAGPPILIASGLDGDDGTISAPLRAGVVGDLTLWRAGARGVVELSTESVIMAAAGRLTVELTRVSVEISTGGRESTVGIEARTT